MYSWTLLIIELSRLPCNWPTLRSRVPGAKSTPCWLTLTYRSYRRFRIFRTFLMIYCIYRIYLFEATRHQQVHRP